MNRRIREDDATYRARLDAIAEQLKLPIRDVPFSTVIPALYGHEVISFDAADPAHLQRRDLLVRAARTVLGETQRTPLHARRINEAGNAIEPLVIRALRTLGWSADKPQTATGRVKPSGYPDIAANDTGNEIGAEGTLYLECKTYNANDAKNADSTFRSFYLSPTEDSKITRAAMHFLLAFALRPAAAGGLESVGFKLLSLDDLSLDLKFEFNSNNRRLYSDADGCTTLHAE